MWLIDRWTDGTSASRIKLPAVLSAAVRRWYTGQGTGRDEAAGIELVRQARLGRKWIACDCLAPQAPPPILTPALLSGVETYYLRRLTGTTRPAHHVECPYARDQATARTYDSGDHLPPSPPPDGYFSLLRPTPEQLAQQPEIDTVDDRTRHEASPRLAQLLRRMLTLASRHRLEPGRRDWSIGAEFAAIRRAAARIEVAPGVALDRVLWIHADAVHRCRARDVLKSLAARWPSGHAPQGFALLFARSFHGHVVTPASGAELHVANRIQSLATHARQIGGPFLVLIVIGDSPDTRLVAPLRGYALPILSGRCFMPIEHEPERHLLHELIVAQRRLRRSGCSLLIEKPLFDLLTPVGECRPHLLVAGSRNYGVERRLGLRFAGPNAATAGLSGLTAVAPVLHLPIDQPPACWCHAILARLFD